ncbi:MAG: holo-ACP synthase [Gemmatimonadota bacterium]
MIVGIGTDIVAVDRIGAFRARHGERGLHRLFASDELDYCLGLARPLPSLAARFAAKEAFFKAVGTGCGSGGRWTDVAVRHDARRAPRLDLRGRAAESARRAGVRRLHLSLSHTMRHATAYVVLEG